MEEILGLVDFLFGNDCFRLPSWATISWLHIMFLLEKGLRDTEGMA